jgi:diguanylate cyclase (GGDEF)-like protein/PAS domain S-box-containing protein
MDFTASGANAFDGPSPRGHVLARLGLLDGRPDETFDRLARLAVTVADAPISLIAFVGDDHEYFRGQVLPGGVSSEHRKAPLTHSLCKLVVEDAAPLIVGDAREDARLHSHPAVRDLGVVAYAGFPLFSDGIALGTLCVGDLEPRTWLPKELDAVRDLADAAATELSLRLALAEQRTLSAERAESERRYRSVIAVMSEGVVLQQAGGAIIACNDAAERILGLTADQMMGRTSVDPAWRAIREDGTDFPGQDHPATRTLRTSLPIRDEIMGVHKPTGELTWIAVCTEPVRIAQGTRAHAVVATFRDITAERAARLELAAHAREQEALREFATLVASEASPHDVFEAAAEHVVRVVDATSGGVVRIEDDGVGRLVGAFAPEGVRIPPVGELIDMELATATVKAICTGRPACVVHGGAAGRNAPPEGAALAVPVTVHGRVWGVVTVHGDLALAAEVGANVRLSRFADLLELAIAGAEAREQLSRMATHDHLTGLFNQRAFTERLGEEVHRARRYGRPLSLVVFDLDHFKLVNDTYGHDVGNTTLAAFADRLAGLRRGGEVIARIGGEEFAWILPDTDGEHAYLAAERARRAIAETPFPGVGRLTTSAGVCDLTEASDPGELFRRADVALYWAKSTSRDATFLYTQEAFDAIGGDDQEQRLEIAKLRAAMRALGDAVDARDASTRRHARRVAGVAAAIARASGWPEERVALLEEAARVHDVGKLAVPDSVLHKPGPLTGDERTRVRDHAVLGAEMVDTMLTDEQVAWVRHHHERYDGAGYPDGLAGPDIPEGARILAVAEAWDAMTVARPFGVPLNEKQAVDEVRAQAGGQFCPAAAQALVDLQRAGRLVAPA